MECKLVEAPVDIAAQTNVNGDVKGVLGKRLGSLCGTTAVYARAVFAGKVRLIAAFSRVVSLANAVAVFQ